jgi:putative flippase GtrA
MFGDVREVDAMGIEPDSDVPAHGVSHLIGRWREWLPGFIAQTARYGAVGVVVTLIYTGLVIFFVDGIGLGDPDLASLFGFAIALPLSYLGHWGITFQRRHRLLDGWQRFAAMSTISFVVAVPGMHLVTHILGWSYLIGLAANWVVAPSINYVVLQLWVFSHRRAS